MKREKNYDLLRVVSTVAVIMIHVSSIWFTEAVYEVAEYEVSVHEIQAAFMISVYYSISRFAVPCFIMLSGAFILDNKKNAEYKKFYSKSFVKIGIPTIIFSILYVFYRISVSCIAGNVGGVGMVVGLLKDMLIGEPMYHMWYLYMLIGVYALAPVVIRFKESITEKVFYKVSFVFLILAGLSQWTTGMIRFMWDVGQAFEYLGYFVAGYCIRKIFASQKNNCKAVISISAGIFLEMCAAGFEYKQIVDGVLEADLRYQIISPYSPFIVLASVLIFLGFTLLNVKSVHTNMGDDTFYIYLIHAGVLDVAQHIYHFIFKGKKFIELNGASCIIQI